MKTFTANEFNKKPGPVYRAADRDGSVRINNQQYSDKIFILEARERQPLEDEEGNHEK